MNAIILTFLLYFSSFEQDSPITYKKQYEFDNYKITTGYYNKVQFMTIAMNNKVIYYSLGGDGEYGEVDTMDINGDGIMDFVFLNNSEDGGELDALLSSHNKQGYTLIEIIGTLESSGDCTISPYEGNEDGWKDFLITDVNQDGKKDLLTMVMVNKNGNILKTGCTLTIMNQQILREDSFRKKNPFIQNPATAPIIY